MKKLRTRKKQLDIPTKCKCEQKGRTLWRIGASGICLRCGCYIYNKWKKKYTMKWYELFILFTLLTLSILAIWQLRG